MTNYQTVQMRNLSAQFLTELNKNNSSIVVTGANGFIGSVVVWELNRLGFENIIAVDTVELAERNLLKNLKFKTFFNKVDFLNLLNGTLKVDFQFPIAWIIHMGACSSTTETNKEFLWENNTEYTQKLFNWSQKNSVGFIYASSAATYGAGENGFDDQFDSEKLVPLNLYGESKVLFDRWAIKQKDTPKNWYGLKFFNVYGPNEYHKESMASVVYKSFNNIKKNGIVQLFKSHKKEYKDGEQLRDFIYVKDVSRWILELMLKKPKNGIYNMGFGRPRSWIDLVSAVFQSMGKSLMIDWIEIPENIRNQYQYFTEAKMDKWFSENLSEPVWPLELGVKDYVENYLSKDDKSLKLE